MSETKQEIRTVRMMNNPWLFEVLFFCRDCRLGLKDSHIEEGDLEITELAMTRQAEEHVCGGQQ